MKKGAKKNKFQLCFLNDFYYICQQVNLKMNFKFISQSIFKISIIFLMLLFFENGFCQEKDYKLYIFSLDNCKICQSYTLKLNQLHDEYNHLVEFVGVFPNLISSEEKIKAYAEKYRVKYNLITDYEKELAKSLEATITPEVFLINNQTNEIVYSGRIDDEFFEVGKRRNVVKNFELKDALKSIENNEPVEIKRTEAIGCYIDFFDSFE